MEIIKLARVRKKILSSDIAEKIQILKILFFKNFGFGMNEAME